MFNEYHDQLRREALDAYPEEAVWLIVSGECRRVANVADDPCGTFRVGRRDMMDAQSRGLLAVVHSHPDYPDCPSEADMRGQMASGVPWGIVATDGQAATPVRWWGHEVREPLVGRGFVHGITDCYSLIRDYYALEHGIDLPEFPRSWEWWRHGQDLYTDGFPRAGFRRIDPVEARAGDMFFAQLRSAVPNHGGIYLGDDLVLHHKTGRQAVDASRLSMREPIARWLPHITHWLRHEDLDT